LTVSGHIPAEVAAQVAQGHRPEPDYLAMARGFGAALLDYGAARRQAGRLGRLLERIGGPNLLLAWVCFGLRGRYRVIFTDGEQVGLPLALLFWLAGGGTRPRHLMIAHWLSVGKKMVLLDLLGLQRHIDVFFVYSSWQKRFIEARWNVPPERVVLTPFMVDANFYDPAAALDQRPPLSVPASPYPMICAVGLELRDYATLIEAVRGLDVHVVIAAASLWSKRSPARLGRSLPANVTLGRFTQFELRRLYAVSRFVVMPLQPVTFQAGVTAILEAMAMGKAVICSRTPGQTDVLEDGATGRYVPALDVAALRAAIVRLLEEPAAAASLGANGRREVLRQFSLEHYVSRLAGYVRMTTAEAASRPVPQT